MSETLDPKNTLLLVALEKELPKKLLPTWNIYYTGVGKVNAALSVVAAFNLYKPNVIICLLYTSPSPRDRTRSRMPSSA